jgi:hypothetical protein
MGFKLRVYWDTFITAVCYRTVPLPGTLMEMPMYSGRHIARSYRVTDLPTVETKHGTDTCRVQPPRLEY